MVDDNEMLLEIDTFDSGTTDNFVTEPTLSTIEVELETETSTGGLLLETGDDVSMEDHTFIEERTFTDGDNIVLNGTDSSSANADSNLILEFADGRHRIVPETFTDGVEITKDITLATFVRVSDSIPDNDVRDVKFNNDGTKMFVLGRANDNVYEYSVATAWNVSSITLVRTLDISVVSSTQGDNAANGIEFNNDGTKMFILGQGQDLVNEYALSTGFDISTASYSQTFSVSDQAVRPSGVRFNSDGTKMYVLEGGTTGEGHNTIYQYALTTAFDVSTASYSGLSASVIDVETRPRGFCFGDNGTQLYVAGWTGDDINQYTSLWPKRATGGTNDARDVDGDGDKEEPMKKAAKDKGYKIKVGRFKFSGSGKALAIGSSEGFIKIIFDEKYGELLGCHIIGHDATELIAELTIAKALETTWQEIAITMHAHPTLSEAIMEAAQDAYGQGIHQ